MSSKPAPNKTRYQRKLSVEETSEIPLEAGLLAVSWGEVDGTFYAAKLYVATARKSDGCIIWKLRSHHEKVPKGNDTFQWGLAKVAARKLAERFAEERNLPFYDTLRQNQKVSETEIPKRKRNFGKPNRSVPKGASFEQAREAIDSLVAKMGRQDWLRGIGVSKDEEGHFVKVNVFRITSVVTTTVPKEIDGIRVKVEAVGNIRALATV